MYQNDDDVMAEEPDQWVMAHFKKWRSRDYPTSTAAYNASLADTTTTTTATEIRADTLSNKENISSNLTDKNSNLNIYDSKQERKEPDDDSSNLIVVATAAAAAAAAAATDIDDKYRNKDIPTEINSSPRFVDVHSHNISNDGEILLLPLISLIYQVKHTDLNDNDLAITDTEVLSKKNANSCFNGLCKSCFE